MEIRVDHHTTRAAARAKVESMLDQLAENYKQMLNDLEHHWVGDSLAFAFRAAGFKVAGTVDITESELILKGKLPLLALAFEPKIRGMVEKEAEKVFPEKKGKKK